MSQGTVTAAGADGITPRRDAAEYPYVIEDNTFRSSEAAGRLRDLEAVAELEAIRDEQA